MNKQNQRKRKGKISTNPSITLFIHCGYRTPQVHNQEKQKFTNHQAEKQLFQNKHELKGTTKSGKNIKPNGIQTGIMDAGTQPSYQFQQKI